MYRILELNQPQLLKNMLNSTQKEDRNRTKWQRRWEMFTQINKQCCIWKSNGKPSYFSRKIFDNNLFVTNKINVTLTPIKPPYNGMHILELRKILMCEFHYDYIESKYGNNPRLLLTETKFNV